MLIIEDVQSLTPYKARIRCYFDRYGTKATISYIYKCFRIKVSGKEVRDLLGVPKYNHALAMGVKQLAWHICGWPKSRIGGGRSASARITSARNWNAVKGGL